MGITASASRAAAKKVPDFAPHMTARVVRSALACAIAGAGPLQPASRTAEKYLAEEGGDVERAVNLAISKHVRFSGTQGFLTNIGGLVTAAVTVPTNMAGLAMIQCRMVAVIAHLRGYDLDDPRVHNAILVCLLGPGEVDRMIKRKLLPAPPMAMATAPTFDPELAERLSNEVATDLITRVLGKRAAVMIGRRVPIVGGTVAMTADGWSSWRIGRYAAKELRARTRSDRS